MDDNNSLPDLTDEQLVDLVLPERREYMDRKFARFRLIDLLMGPQNPSQRVRVIPPHVMALLDAYEHAEKPAPK